MSGPGSSAGARTRRFDVTALGEVLLRLSVPLGGRLETATCVDVHVAGAEANVVAALAGLGRRVAWSGGLPDGRLGAKVVRHLRAAGVTTDLVVTVPGARLGTYYVELAAPPRRTDVVYDRAGSAASLLQADDVPWDALLDTRVLHLTGITPALGEGPAAVVAEAVRRARADGVKVSFDVNYRAKLWSPDAAAQALTPLLREVDLLVCGEADAAALFALDGDPGDVLRGLAGLAPRAAVVLTRGGDGASALESGRATSAAAVPVQVLDGLGAGDAFTAGVLDAWLDGSLERGLRQGVMLASMALGSDGDALLVTRQELDSLLTHDERRVRR